MRGVISLSHGQVNHPKNAEPELFTSAETLGAPAADQLTASAPAKKKAAKTSKKKPDAAATAPAPETTHRGATATNNQPTAEAGSPTEAPADRLDQIFEGLKQKSTAKQAIFRNTQAAFDCLRLVSQELVVELSRKLTPLDSSVAIEYRPVNEMEFHIRFSGDLLMFIMHSNIVTFADDYGPMSTTYVNQDFRRRFFGHIMAYNFMADSIKYHRLNDPGYLVGRLLINIDNHYYLEGVQQARAARQRYVGQHHHAENHAPVCGKRHDCRRQQRPDCPAAARNPENQRQAKNGKPAGEPRQ
ncbi:hypothetical protein ACFQT0_13065 [Hymenobacter humi]|uniref:Uncharacterized protein n=1 Tax=Hymenobacter humi TaxID=1411620 RepID=A0ABW2U5L2_9BACT